MKIGWFVGHPGNEVREGLVREQGGPSVSQARKFGVREVGVDCPVAYRMERHGLASALGFWHGVMLLDAASERAAA